MKVPLEPEVYDLIFTEGEPDGLWPVTPDASQHVRRSLYLFNKRNVRNPLFEAFDQPEQPSTQDTEYQAFVATQTSLQTFWSRLESYGGAWQLLGNAALLTLVVSVASMLVAIGFGLLLVICRLFAPLPVRWFATTYIEVIRGTPLLIQLLFIFYGLPKVGLQLSPFVASVLGLGLNYAASEAENYRAGLLSVPEGQWQAARAATRAKTAQSTRPPPEQGSRASTREKASTDCFCVDD